MNNPNHKHEFQLKTVRRRLVGLECACGFSIPVEQLPALANEYSSAVMELWEIQHSPINTGCHAIDLIAGIVDHAEQFGCEEPEQKFSRRNYREREGELAKAPEPDAHLFGYHPSRRGFAARF